MLYVMNVAKLVFPFVTLPYLTRVLSVEGYAMVSYVKSVMQYMQLLMDFGFMLSATTAIVSAEGDGKKLGSIVSTPILAQLPLRGAALIILAVMTAAIDLLRQNTAYVLLSFVTVALSAFLVDYLFRGLEQMQEITIRFVTMKGIATALTFFLPRSVRSSSVRAAQPAAVVGSAKTPWVFSSSAGPRPVRSRHSSASRAVSARCSCIPRPCSPAQAGRPSQSL